MIGVYRVKPIIIRQEMKGKKMLQDFMGLPISMNNVVVRHIKGLPKDPGILTYSETIVG